MMFLPMIRNRRSIRSFTDQPVEPEKVSLLVEAALRSPSSRSLNPWEFILVTDKTMLKELAACKPHGASFLKGAPLGIVVLADPERCDVWVEDCSIACTYIQLAAEDLGLKSCWIQIRKREYDDSGKMASDRVAELLGIPESMEVTSIIAVGYPSQELKGHPRESLGYQKVFEGTYGNSYSE